MIPSRYASIARQVAPEDVKPGEPVIARLVMNEADRLALAEEFGIPAVTSLTGNLKAARRAGLIEVEGELSSTLIRHCVATLEEMTEEVGEEFNVTFTEEAPPTREGEVEADLDAPEFLGEGGLDLGAVLVEQLVLAMDPHPRIAGADPIADPGAGARISPFNVLGQLKKDE